MFSVWRWSLICGVGRRIGSLYYKLHHSWLWNKKQHVIFWRHSSCDPEKGNTVLDNDWHEHLGHNTPTSPPSPTSSSTHPPIFFLSFFISPLIFYLSLSAFCLVYAKNKKWKAKIKPNIQGSLRWHAKQETWWHRCTKHYKRQGWRGCVAIITSALLARAFPYRWTFK